MRRGRRRDAGDDAAAVAFEIRHAGRAIVDDRQPPAAEIEIAQRRQAGMGAGKDVDLRRAMHVGEPVAPFWIVEFVLREAPAGQRRGVAMHDADA